MERVVLVFGWGSILLAFLTYLTFVLPCHVRTRLQAIAAMILLLGGMKFIGYYYFGKSAFNPEFPVALIRVWDVLHATVVFLFLLSIVFFFLRPRVKFILLPILSLGLAIWGCVNAVQVPDVREVTIRSARVPAELDGYRIVHLSDLHISSALRRPWVRALVKRVNDLHPDLIACTGDYVDGRVAQRVADVFPLRSLSAPDGVWYVTGNHEYYRDSLAWQTWFENNGFRFLHGEAVTVRSGLSLIGVDDSQAYYTKPSTPTVGDAMRQLSATNANYTILLQHRPLYARVNLTAYPIDLQLSGHTHGGIFPGLRSLVGRVNNGFVKGTYTIGSKNLNVSSGAGIWAGFPIRLFTPSEITLITLKSAPAQAAQAAD